MKIFGCGCSTPTPQLLDIASVLLSQWCYLRACVGNGFTHPLRLPSMSKAESHLLLCACGVYVSRNFQLSTRMQLRTHPPQWVSSEDLLLAALFYLHSVVDPACKIVETCRFFVLTLCLITIVLRAGNQISPGIPVT